MNMVSLWLTRSPELSLGSTSLQSSDMRTTFCGDKRESLLGNAMLKGNAGNEADAEL